ncbi:MAG: hypothetical protein KF901_08145 [Myxococcales bacterium]|nr:hypothetical protein [Myxococcales bacterium]
MTTTRRDFVRTLALIAGTSLLACGDDDDDPTMDAGEDPMDAGDDPMDAGEDPMDAGRTDAGEDPTDAGEDPDAGPMDAGDPPVACDSVTTTIGTNHAGGQAHAVTVPAADVAAGEPRTYTLSGGNHTHTIMVSAEDFAMLASGATVMVTSSGNGAGNHTHVVTLACAADEG